MNRTALINHIELWKNKLGSYSEVAKYCQISTGSLSTVMAGKYGAKENTMLQKIAKALDFRERDWSIVRSLGNYKAIASVVEDAKSEAMWFCLSNKAGSGKTETLQDVFNEDKTGSVFYIAAEEWSARTFLINLIKKVISPMDGNVAWDTTGKGYRSVAQLLEVVANFFNEMSFDRPVLIIDEADKLKAAALRTLIPLFNRTEDRLGVVLSGTENLEKEIKKGVRLAKKGFDELESRFGRTYVHLKGMLEKDVYAVCTANGLTMPERQSIVWGELEKENKLTTVKTAQGEKKVMLPYVEDFRRLKRLIKREKLMTKRRAA